MTDLLTGAEAASTVLANPDKYAPLFLAALKHSNGNYALSDIAAGINNGEYGVWLAGESVVLTEAAVYPRKKRLSLFLGAGNRPEVVGLLPALERFAIEQGCSGVEFLGRKGWLRAMPRGYRAKSYLIAKEF